MQVKRNVVFAFASDPKGGREGGREGVREGKRAR